MVNGKIALRDKFVDRCQITIQTKHWLLLGCINAFVQTKDNAISKQNGTVTICTFEITYAYAFDIRNNSGQWKNKNKFPFVVHWKKRLFDFLFCCFYNFISSFKWIFSILNNPSHQSWLQFDNSTDIFYRFFNYVLLQSYIVHRNYVVCKYIQLTHLNCGEYIVCSPQFWHIERTVKMRICNIHFHFDIRHNWNHVAYEKNMAAIIAIQFFVVYVFILSSF